MSDIKSKPDENGVPMCDYMDCDSADECPSNACLASEDGKGYCYPKMVEIVKALQGMVAVVNGGESAITRLAALTKARKALSHE